MKARAMFVIAAWLLGSAAFAQTPPRDVRTTAPSGPAGTATVSGSVIAGDAVGRPLRMAYVVLIGTVTGTLRVSATDASGRFAFAGLPADHYLVGASKPPYLGAVAGAKRPARVGTPVAVRDGEQVSNVTVRLPLAAAVAGTVTDERGTPVAGALILVQRWQMQNGERTLVQSGGGATTDDRGRFRAYGLLPGEYVVGALRPGVPVTPRPLTDAAVDAALRSTTPPPPAPAVPASPAPALRYVPVYFPGTTRAAEAGPVVLASGEERQNVDIRLEAVTTSAVEGQAIRADGQPLTALVVSLISTSNVFSSGYQTSVTPDGRFSLKNVGPGSYTVVGRTGGPTPQFGSTAIEVAGNDISSVHITLRPPVTMSGRFVFEGRGTPPSPAGRRLTLRSLTPIVGAPAPQPSPTSQTGAFTISNLSPGRYVIGGTQYFGANADSVTWALDTVTIDGRDVTDLPFEVGTEAPPKEMVVTFVDRWQEIRGTLAVPGGATSASDYTIIVFPANRAYWLQGSRRILITRAATDGSFAFGGPGPAALPPGDYLVAALTDIERDEQFDPAFLAAVLPAAVPVSVSAGDRKVQDLTIR